MGTKQSNNVNLPPSNVPNSINQHRSQSSTLSKTKRNRCPICNTVIEQKTLKEFQAHFNQCQLIKKNKNCLNNLLVNPQVNDNLDAINLIISLQSKTNLLEQKNLRALNQPLLVNQFEDKIDSFRAKLKKMKVDWMNGCHAIEVDREDIVNQSMKQFNKIDPYKELKIAFKGEVNHDAGGLIREWLSVLFKMFFDEKTNLFERADTEDISYFIKTGLVNTPLNSSIFFFIGELIGKALLENLTINCCFNKLIYKVILDETIAIEDLIFIDKRLFHSLEEIKNNKSVEDLELYYSLQYETDTGVIQTEELIDDGDNIKVTNDNVDDYIFLRIDYLVNRQKEFIDQIKDGIDKIIKIDNLRLLTSDEFELVLNGTPFIDLQDWKESATYKDYKKTDYVIVSLYNI